MNYKSYFTTLYSILGISQGWIPIQELKNYYLTACDGTFDFEGMMLFGKPHKEKPTLTGWITFWREFQKFFPDIVITYKVRK